MHARTLALIALLTAQLLGASAAQAYSGVPRVPDPYLNDGAMATMDGWGNAVIVYNPAILGRYSADAQRFVFAHEEAHHALGHVWASAGANAWMRQGMESEADCAAASWLASMGDYRAVHAGADALAGQGAYSADPLHPSGRARAQGILACAGL